MEKQLRVAGYCRVSTKLEMQQFSLTEQINQISKIIEETPNYVNVGVYVDAGISGRKAQNRPEFRRLIKDARDGKIDLILTKSISRFGRNTVETMQAIEDLRKVDVAVKFLVEGIDTITNENDMVLTTYAQIAESELDDISTNAKWSVQRRYEKGQLVMNPHVLMGYELIDKKLEIVEEEAKIIRYIYEQYAAEVPVAKIVKELDKREWRTLKGSKITNSTIHYILTNEKYMGDAILQKYVSINGQSRKNRNMATMYYIENDHEPIVSKELWNKCQEIRKSRACIKSQKRELGKNPFRGVIYCGYCGRTYRRVVHSSDSNGKVWYLCGTIQTAGRRYCKNSESVKEETIIAILNEIANNFIRQKRKNIKDIRNIETDEIDRKLEELSSKESIFLKMDARGVMNENLEIEHRKIISRINELENKKKQLINRNSTLVQQRNDLIDFNNGLDAIEKGIKTPLECLKDLVIKIKVYGRETIIFELKNGQNAEAMIEFEYKEQDEIGGIKYVDRKEDNDNPTD